MLVLRRKAGEAIVLNGVITIHVLAVEGERVKLGISAPPEVVIVRSELLEGQGPMPGALNAGPQSPAAPFGPVAPREAPHEPPRPYQAEPGQGGQPSPESDDANPGAPPAPYTSYAGYRPYAQRRRAYGTGAPASVPVNAPPRYRQPDR